MSEITIQLIPSPERDVSSVSSEPTVMEMTLNNPFLDKMTDDLFELVESPESDNISAFDKYLMQNPPKLSPSSQEDDFMKALYQSHKTLPSPQYVSEEDLLACFPEGSGSNIPDLPEGYLDFLDDFLGESSSDSDCSDHVEEHLQLKATVLDWASRNGLLPRYGPLLSYVSKHHTDSFLNPTYEFLDPSFPKSLVPLVEKFMNALTTYPHYVQKYFTIVLGEIITFSSQVSSFYSIPVYDPLLSDPTIGYYSRMLLLLGEVIIIDSSMKSTLRTSISRVNVQSHTKNRSMRSHVNRTKRSRDFKHDWSIREFSKVRENSIDKFYHRVFFKRIRDNEEKYKFFSALHDRFFEEHALLYKDRVMEPYVHICYSPAAKILLNARSWNMTTSQLRDLKSKAYFYYVDTREQNSSNKPLIAYVDDHLYIKGYPVIKEKLYKAISTSRRTSEGLRKNPNSLIEMVLFDNVYANQQYSLYYLTEYVSKAKPFWMKDSFIKGYADKRKSMLDDYVVNYFLSGIPPAVKSKVKLNPRSAEYKPSYSWAQSFDKNVTRELGHRLTTSDDSYEYEYTYKYTDLYGNYVDDFDAHKVRMNKVFMALGSPKELIPEMDRDIPLNEEEPAVADLFNTAAHDRNTSNSSAQRLRRAMGDPQGLYKTVMDDEFITGRTTSGTKGDPHRLNMKSPDIPPQMWFTTDSIYNYYLARGCVQFLGNIDVQRYSSYKRSVLESPEDFFNRVNGDFINAYSVRKGQTIYTTIATLKAYKPNAAVMSQNDFAAHVERGSNEPVPDFIDQLNSTLQNLSGLDIDFDWRPLVDSLFLCWRFYVYDDLPNYIQSVYMASRLIPDTFSPMFSASLVALKTASTALTAYMESKNVVLVPEALDESGYVVLGKFMAAAKKLFMRLSIFKLLEMFGLSDKIGLNYLVEKFDHVFIKDPKDPGRMNLLSTIYEVIVKAIELLVECFNKRSFAPLFSGDRDIDDIFKDVAHITSYPHAIGTMDGPAAASFNADKAKGNIIPSTFTRIVTNAQALEIIASLREEVVRYHQANLTYPNYLITHNLSKLNEKEALIKADETTYARRIPALVMRIYGPPDVGKSYLVKDFMSVSHIALGGDGILSDKDIYYMSFASKHFDGIRPSTFGLVMDDMDHSAINKDGLELLAKTITDAVNCTIWRPPMADLSEKGIMIAPVLAIQTTNLPDGGIGEAVIAPALAAHKRRVHWQVTVRVLTGYANQLGGVDMEKVTREGKNYTDVIRYDVKKYVGATDKLYEEYENIMINKMMRLFKKDLLDYRARHADEDSSLDPRCVHCSLHLTKYDHWDCTPESFQDGWRNVVRYYIPPPRLIGNGAYTALYYTNRQLIGEIIILHFLAVSILAGLHTSSLLNGISTFIGLSFALQLSFFKVREIGLPPPHLRLPFRDAEPSLDWTKMKKIGVAALLAVGTSYSLYKMWSKNNLNTEMLKVSDHVGPSILPNKMNKNRVKMQWEEYSTLDSTYIPTYTPTSTIDPQDRSLKVYHVDCKQRTYGLLVKAHVVLVNKHLFFPPGDIATYKVVSGCHRLRIDYGTYSNEVVVSHFANFPDKDLVMVYVPSLTPYVVPGSSLLDNFLPDNSKILPYSKNCLFVNADGKRQIESQVTLCDRPGGGSKLLKYVVDGANGDCLSTICSDYVIIGVHVAASPDGTTRYGEILKRSDIVKMENELMREVGGLKIEGMFLQLEHILPKPTTTCGVPSLSNVNLNLSIRNRLGVYHPISILFNDPSEVSFSHKTNLVPSPFRENSNLESFFNKYGASMFDYAPAEARNRWTKYNDSEELFYETPFSKNLLGMKSNSIASLEWERAIATYMDFLYEPCEKLSPLSDYETIKGTSYLNRLNSKSSGGAQYGPNSENFDFTCDPDVEVTQAVLDRMNEIIDIAGQGIVPLTSCKRQLKDELKSFKQIAEGKIRVFSVTQVPFILACRKYLGPLVKIMRTNWRNMMCTMGYDLSHGFNLEIMEHLQYFKHGAITIRNGYYALDFKSFDLVGDDDMILKVCVMVRNILEDHGYTHKDATIAAILFYACFLALNNIKGDYFQIVHMLNSGQFITFMFNCIKAALTYLVAYYRLVPNKTPGFSINKHYSSITIDKSFRLNVSALFCGDDAFMYVVDWVRKYFTQKSIKEALLDVMDVQPEKKDHEMRDCLTFEEATFMKRSYREILVQDTALYVSPLEIASLAKSLSHYNTKVPGLLSEHLGQMREFFLRECFHHGEDFYNEARACFTDLPPDYPMWRDRVPEFLAPGFQSW